jgi:hypothetical protein
MKTVEIFFWEIMLTYVVNDQANYKQIVWNCSKKFLQNEKFFL